jgi:predicted HTH transcriptional regulator
LLAEDDLHWLEEFEGQLSDAERLALVTARHHGLVDNASLRDLTGLQVAEVTKVLGGLRDKKLLRMRGAKRGAWYELGAEAPEPPDDRHQLPIPGFDAEHMGVSSNWNESSGGLPVNSEGLQPSSGGLPVNSEGLQTADELKRLAEEVSGKGKITNARMQKVILELCSVTPLSLDELAKLLKRSKDHLRGTLRQLIDEGALKYEFPSVPQHPRQRYITLTYRNE